MAEQLDKLKDILKTSKEAMDEADHIANRLLAIKVQLLEMSNIIIDHIENGDASNQEKNSKLWHDLNNVIHQFNSFAQFGPDIFKDAQEATKTLVAALQEVRPS